ncbi:MAG: calcium/sodium antiporter [Pseudohongiellaceae bacterium]|nr:calcium/sodium antiporter [Pseudohongiellaceae bacterium]
MLLDIVIVVCGFAGLIWGADKFVAGASSIAKNLGVAPLLIGLTVVAFGTSAPEFFSSAIAAIEDHPELAIGNAIGSNIFNIGVALGLTALIRPLAPSPSLLKKELPALFLVTIVSGILLADLYLGPLDGLALIALTVFLCYRLIKKKAKKAEIEEIEGSLDINSEFHLPEMSKGKAVFFLLLGLVFLIGSAEALVRSASSIATELGVSSAIIGLTIVALGTSLPELAACITSALRGHDDLALGNIVGSNIMNFLVVLPFPGLLSPGTIENALFTHDFSTFFGLTALLGIICYWAIKTKKKIGRLSGASFLLIYGIWFSTLF